MKTKQQLDKWHEAPGLSMALYFYLHTLPTLSLFISHKHILIYHRFDYKTSIKRWEGCHVVCPFPGPPWLDKHAPEVVTFIHSELEIWMNKINRSNLYKRKNIFDTRTIRWIITLKHCMIYPYNLLYIYIWIGIQGKVAKYLKQGFPQNFSVKEAAWATHACRLNYAVF